MIRRIRSVIFTEANKNSFVLLYGTVISQALPLLFSPVLARLYSPEEFGAFSLFFAIVAVLGNMSAGKFDLALYTSKTKQNAIFTVITGLVFAIGFSLLIFLVCGLVIGFAETDKLSWMAVVCIPFTVLALGSSNVFVGLSNREKRFKYISRAKMLLGATWVAVNLLAGLFNGGVMGLILGYALGQLVSSAYLYHINKSDFENVSYNRRTFKFNVLRNKNYAFIFLPAHLLNTLSASGPSFFLSYLFGLNDNGFFFKAGRIGESPTNIIRSSLGNVFWQQASHDYINTGNARPVMKTFFLKLLVIGFPGYLILYLFSEQLFVFLFGQPWIEAAKYFQILAPYFFLQFVITPLTILVVLSNKPWIDITWQVFYALSIALSFGYGWLQNDVFVGLRLYTIMMSAMQLISLSINYHYSIKR
jgi:O-antigen/teichoic acid export membrane protein